MRPSLSCWFAFLLIWILVGCEEEINRPVFITQEVIELNSDGVTFRGKAQFIGNTSIDNYGFVWSDRESPTESDAAFFFDKQASLGGFQHRVIDGLIKGTRYYVRVCAKWGGQTFYGNNVEFIAVGSTAPVVDDFTPTTNKTISEFEITGNHFGTSKSNVTVKIGSAVCTVVSVTNTKLTVQITPPYTPGSFPITVQIGDKSVTTKKKFSLWGPIIDSISPSSGPGGTLVTISGTGFLEVFNQPTEVYFDGYDAVIKSITETTIVVYAPSLTDGEKEVTVKLPYSYITGISPTPFNLTGPVITSISPESGPPGTIVTITGSGFYQNITGNTVDFGGYYLPILSATTNELIVEMTPLYSGSDSQIIANIVVQVGGAFSFSPNPFTLNGPMISSFDPPEQYEGRPVTIHGDNFDPDGNMSIFFIKHTNEHFEATIQSVSKTSVTVIVPFIDGEELASQVGLKIISNRYTYSYPNKFTILTP